MSNKVFITLLFLVVLIPTVNAGLYQLQVPITMEFNGDSNFDVKWDGGMKHYQWTNSSHPASETFTMTIYRDLNATLVCSAQTSSYQNLTNKLATMITTCNNLADANNVSMAQEYANAQYSLGLQTQKLEQCQNNMSNTASKADQYDSCALSKFELQTQYNTCSTDLTNQKKSGSSTPFLAAVGGIFAGYLFWGRKPKTAPSEYQEEGFDNY